MKKNKGKYVKPENWNSLINGEDVVLVDVRNMLPTLPGGIYTPTKFKSHFLKLSSHLIIHTNDQVIVWRNRISGCHQWRLR